MRVSRFACLITLLALGAAGPLRAQDEEPAFDELVATFQQPYLTIGMLVQAVADLQVERSAPGNTGFLLGNARLRLNGTLDNGFGYLFQTNFVAGPTILDAQVHYRFAPALSVSAGKFKTPFSYEFLVYAGNIDFVNRSTTVSALVPGRQLGADVTLGRPNGVVTLTAGVFNGNRFTSLGNDGDGVLVASRVAARPLRGDDDGARLVVGANAAFSRDSSVTIPLVADDFAGDRTLLGADARLTVDRVMLSGEVIWAHLSPTTGTAIEPWGFHATAGYRLGDNMQALLRWDQFRPGPGPTGRFVVLGYNVWPTSATEVQVNYLIDADDAALDHHQLLVNFQLGF